jgi:hypothetical protein
VPDRKAIFRSLTSSFSRSQAGLKLICYTKKLKFIIVPKKMARGSGFWTHNSPWIFFCHRLSLH